MRVKLLASILLVTAIWALAQTPKREPKPLDKIRVLALLASSVPSQRVAQLVEGRGIDFEPTEDYLDTLQSLGADEGLLTAIREARRVPTPAAAPPALSRQEEVQ